MGAKLKQCAIWRYRYLQWRWRCFFYCCGEGI